MHMALFDDMLKDNESLFRNEIALDPEFMPKKVTYRENENQVIALRIRPLFQKRNGSNLLIYGPPGIGKTVAVKKVLEELDEVSEEISQIYTNCWQNNSSYKVALSLCKDLGYQRTVNKHTNELIDAVVSILNKGSSVLVFDEIDRTADLDFLYALLEKLYRKTIILITNYKDTLLNVDERIQSRLTPEMLEFKPYSLAETRGVLEQRKEYAFVPEVWEEHAFEEIVNSCYEMKDIRKGLFLMRESGNIAESRANKKITVEDARNAIKKVQSSSLSKEIDDDSKLIMSVVKEIFDEERIGKVFELYQERGGNSSYKTFQRKIEKLAMDKKILTRKVLGGIEGTTTIVSKYEEKKLTDF